MRCTHTSKIPPFIYEFFSSSKRACLRTAPADFRFGSKERLNSVRVVVATVWAADAGISVEIVFTEPDFVLPPLALLLPDGDDEDDGCVVTILCGCCARGAVPDGCLAGEIESVSVSRCSSACNKCAYENVSESVHKGCIVMGGGPSLTISSSASISSSSSSSSNSPSSLKDSSNSISLPICRTESRRNAITKKAHTKKRPTN